MRLGDLQAVAHPFGHRIDLSWVNPDPVGTPGVRVTRREGTYPTGPTDGVPVADLTGRTSYSDEGLPGETVFYYALFPFSGSPPAFAPDPANRVSAMTTTTYGFGGRMYDLLPRIYQRFDTTLPPPGTPGLSPEDLRRGELRRFLDLPGSQLDQLHSLVHAALRLHDVTGVDGALLPLLADWIGWRTDRSLPLAGQRNEIRFAPELFRTVGTAPVLRATAGRITGWPSRTKEYVHNVARTNTPERLNLWSLARDTAGSWGGAALMSLNFAYEGRPVLLPDPDGSDRLIYQTRRGAGWQVWTKRRVAGAWQPSEPLVTGPGQARHPAAAVQGDRLWVFWESLDETRPAVARHWRVMARSRAGGVWSEPVPVGDPAVEQRRPAAAVDGTGALWLFWREFRDGAWSVRYAQPTGAGWPATAQTLPDDAGAPVRVDDDLAVMAHPGRPGRPLWLFWATRRPAGPPGQTRWSISWRTKAGLDPAVSADWSAVATLPGAGPGGPAADDRDPCPLPTAAGDVELFWSSTRPGGWGLARAVLDVAAGTWSAPEAVGTGPATRRGPAALAGGAGGAGVLLVHLSNASLPNGGADVPVSTLDVRYAGTTTVRAADAAKRALTGSYDDFQSYTYTRGRRIARDSVGLFLDPDPGATPAEVAAARARLAGVLDEFVPITSRFVLVTP